MNAGWYNDPSGTPQERYWSGSEWTTQTRPFPAPAERESAPLMMPPQVAERPKANSGRWILGVIAAVVVVGLVVGGMVLNRMRIDQEARDAAQRGANLGGTSNSYDTMYDLLCPQGPATDTSGSGVDCTNPLP